MTLSTFGLSQSATPFLRRAFPQDLDAPNLFSRPRLPVADPVSLIRQRNAHLEDENAHLEDEIASTVSLEGVVVGDEVVELVADRLGRTGMGLSHRRCDQTEEEGGDSAD
jgi:hypothetical protein